MSQDEQQNDGGSGPYAEEEANKKRQRKEQGKA
jgi:hypothetical protein